MVESFQARINVGRVFGDTPLLLFSCFKRPFCLGVPRLWQQPQPVNLFQDRLKELSGDSNLGQLDQRAHLRGMVRLCLNPLY